MSRWVAQSLTQTGLNIISVYGLTIKLFENHFGLRIESIIRPKNEGEDKSRQIGIRCDDSVANAYTIFVSLMETKYY